MGVADRLSEVMNRFGYTVKDLSERSGIPYRSCLNYVNGEREPNAEALRALSARLGVNLNWLLTEQGYMTLRDEEVVRKKGQTASKSDVVSLEDAPKERIKAWLDEWWANASPRQRTWLEVQAEHCFGDYVEWLKKHPANYEKRAIG